MENYALFKLKKELAKIKKRLRNDLIEDLRFMSEVQEDKLKVKQLKRAIEILEKKV